MNGLVNPNGSNPLARLEQAATMLAQAKTIDEVKHVRDVAEAVRAYAKQARLGLTAQNDAAAIKINAERRAGEMLKGMPKAKGAQGSGSNQHEVRSHDDTAPTLESLDLNKSQASRWQKMTAPTDAECKRLQAISTAAGIEHTSKAVLELAKVEPENRARVLDAIESGAAERVPDAIREIRRAERDERLRRGERPLTAVDGKYNLILADPPWEYEFSATRSREIENQYPTMDLASIRALPVPDIAAPDCILLLWTTAPKLAESLMVVDSWGFEYRTVAIWDKLSLGMGHYFRIGFELLMVATQGKPGVPEPENRPASPFAVARREHSRKPNEILTMLDRMWPQYADSKYRIELFSRERKPTWSVWGNEAL